MARVFLGSDEVLDRAVAVKVLNPGFDDGELGERFQREGRTAARLSHPNVVQVYDAGEGEFDGRPSPYIVMEYVPGGDLKDYIDQKGTLSEAELSRIGAEVARGLSHAHEKGVVHRDIKPHNILMDEHGAPKVTDFGIARALGVTQTTRTGAYLGTALYSSPEQLRGEKVTPKSDVYSLGATLYQAAVGKPPFAGSPIDVASQHVEKWPIPASRLRPGLDRGLEAQILACLEKEPARRPEADELADRLSVTGAPTAVTQEYSTSSPYHLTDGARRKKSRRAGPLVVGLALLISLLGMAAVAGAFMGEDAGGGSQQQAQEQGVSGSPAQGDGVAANSSDSGSPPSASGSPEAEARPSGGGDGVQGQPSGEEPQSAGSGGDEAPGGGGQKAAEQAVRDHYAAAANGSYDRAWGLLSSGYQGSVGSMGAWTGQFDTLERVEFVQGPEAKVSGNTATVSFSTVAYHEDKTDRRQGEATLVKEDGQWKIDGLGF